MALPNTAKVTEELPSGLRIAFAPLKRVALGLAFGVTMGLGLFVFGLVHLFPGMEEQDRWIGLIEHNFLPGYTVTVGGCAIGFLWGLLIGFVTGWLLAAVRNFSVALWVAIAGAREQLRMDQDFLDEI